MCVCVDVFCALSALPSSGPPYQARREPVASRQEEAAMGHGYSKSEDSSLHPPSSYRTPPFPSLYNPRRDFSNKTPVQYLFYSSGLSHWITVFSNAIHLPRTKSADVFRFTLYWTLIFYAATYGVCGIWASLIAGYASRRRKKRSLTAILAVLPFLVFGGLSAVVGSAITGEDLSVHLVLDLCTDITCFLYKVMFLLPCTQ